MKMQRNIENIQRDFEDKKRLDIIWKKHELFNLFNADPDLKNMLGIKEKRPLNTFADKNNPTEDELKTRREIENYNEKITHPQIVPYMKLVGIQNEVQNFILFDINDSLDRISRKAPNEYNAAMKTQIIHVWCLVHESDVMTEFDSCRVDELASIVQELLHKTNCLGSQLTCVNSEFDIIDKLYYARKLQFACTAINQVNGKGVRNPYDRY